MNANTNTASVLSEYDFIIVADASGSMSEDDVPGGNRWNYMQEAIQSFARELNTIDQDGIGLVIFGGSNIQSFDGCDNAKIKAAFGARRPSGSTPLAEALSAALVLAGKSDKKDFIIVFTDGVPDNREAAARVITGAANRQETDDSLTILFIQVGHDAQAGKYLASLDDDLKGKFDIVDAKTQAEAEAFPSLEALIVAAIND